MIKSTGWTYLLGSKRADHHWLDSIKNLVIKIWATMQWFLMLRIETLLVSGFLICCGLGIYNTPLKVTGKILLKVNYYCTYIWVYIAVRYIPINYIMTPQWRQDIYTMTGLWLERGIHCLHSPSIHGTLGHIKNTFQLWLGHRFTNYTYDSTKMKVDFSQRCTLLSAPILGSPPLSR